MPAPHRLQPVEIHPSLLQKLEKWQEFGDDASVSTAFHEDGKELGPLNAELSQASMAWSMSAILGELATKPEIMNALRPPPKDIPRDVHFFMNAEGLTSNSIVFRTYVSVVLGRTDRFLEAISQISRRNSSEHFSATLKLVRSDEVRYLRNAIGHGTFLAQGQVLRYKDGDKTRRISYRELDKVNGAIWAVVLAGLVGSFKWVKHN